MIRRFVTRWYRRLTGRTAYGDMTGMPPLSRLALRGCVTDHARSAME